MGWSVTRLVARIGAGLLGCFLLFSMGMVGLGQVWWP